MTKAVMILDRDFSFIMLNGIRIVKVKTMDENNNFHAVELAS